MATDFSLPVFTITDITISGTPYKLPVFQTGKTVKVKLAVSPFTEYTGTEEGTSGVYKFTNIEDGKYHKLVNGVQSGTFGVTNGRYIPDDDLPYAKLAGGNTLSGDQTLNDNLNVLKQIQATLDIIARELFVDAAGTPFTTNTPSFSSSLVWKSWVDAQIAAIVITPYQESNNLVRCIPNGTEEPNKVYRTPKKCSNSFATPSQTNPCMVEIVSNGNAQYVNLWSNTLRNYVHFAGKGRHVKVIMSDGFSNTKIMNWERLTLIFGAIDYTVAREYSSMTFKDCDIFAYKDTTFNNCTLIRCRIFHASTYKAYLKGSTTVEVCGFNNEPDLSLISDPAQIVGDYKAPLIGGMPADPSTVEIPSEE